MFRSFLPLVCGLSLIAVNTRSAEDQLAALPQVGSNELLCISPTVLELSLVSTKDEGTAPPKAWNFVDGNGRASLPSPDKFVVTVDGTPVTVISAGFRRRVLYAPLKKRDLRIGNYIYLAIGKRLKEGQLVEVKNPDHKLWESNKRYFTRFDPMRWSPAIHVNQTGYSPDHPKTAMVGYYLGSLGELQLDAAEPPDKTEKSKAIPATNFFFLINAATGKEVYKGALTPRADRGFPSASYQLVWMADFSAFIEPGQYRLFVPGLGSSYSFFIDPGSPAAFARTYALGLYHQRCGTSNSLPFTRYTDGSCHTAPVSIPIPESAFKTTWEILADKTTDVSENPRHTAPRLRNVKSLLYPFTRTGTIDARGGHHDAGDYSKYTINSAALIHHLVFAADTFPGAVQLDNLGIPESGDGRSDLLQEAKWEADFLAKIQDDDGGFYFLVYPREREYENDVTPDHGDKQLVWPKTTAVTAAAVAALAQTASSPAFKKQFPEASALYLKKAKAGWSFLERAIAQHGKDGAYQKITHYGNEFMHDDELAWAAVEMYLATGDSKYERRISEWFDPSSPDTRKWGWQRLFEAYGCATRSYAFAVKSGRIEAARLERSLLAKCEDEIIAAAKEQASRAEDSAYGTSFPKETKQSRSAGWYFSGDAAFDLAVAYQLDFPSKNDPRPAFMRAIWSNLNYEQGCNPVNVCYLTGLGWKRQFEIVDQNTQNNQRALPRTGIPLGNIQGGFGWLDKYGKELGNLSFPPDDDKLAPYPFYDRWGDSFNLSQEFVVVNQARSLAYLSWLMAQSSLRDQPWNSAPGTITGIPAKPLLNEPVTMELTAQGLDLKVARIIWEGSDQKPVIGQKLVFKLGKSGTYWIEAEAQLVDGRRVFARQTFSVK